MASNLGDFLCKAFNLLFWLLLFLFLSWGLACLCFPFYVLFSVVAVVLPGLSGIADLLLKGIQFPAICFGNALNLRSYGDIQNVA